MFENSDSHFSRPFFLGLDASTQSIKASLLSNNLDVISEIAVNFDVDLPQYGTKGGVLMGEKGSGMVYSPVVMVLEAMDLLLDRMKEKGWALHKVRGVAAAGQVSQYAPHHRALIWIIYSNTHRCTGMSKRSPF